jgi:hypothetical protein
MARNNNNILNRHLSRRRSRPQQNWQNYYKYKAPVLIWSISELQFPSWCALQLQFGVHMWRRVAGAAAAATSFQYWVEYLLARVWTI